MISSTPSHDALVEITFHYKRQGSQQRLCASGHPKQKGGVIAPRRFRYDALPEFVTIAGIGQYDSAKSFYRVAVHKCLVRTVVAPVPKAGFPWLDFKPDA